RSAPGQGSDHHAIARPHGDRGRGRGREASNFSAADRAAGPHSDGDAARTRAPEAVASLVAALDDPSPETQLAAVRGLARTGLRSAGEAMLERVLAGSLALPGTSLMNALIACTRANPRVLLPYLHLAHGPVRELLARVMAEVASVSLGDDLLLLASDVLPEVRASAARALGHAEFG